MEGLAPIIVQELSVAIRRLVDDSGMAVVLVEQHAQLALSLTAQAIVLDRGRVVHAPPARRCSPTQRTLERLVTVSAGGPA